MGHNERLSAAVMVALWLLSIPATTTYSNCSLSYYANYTNDLGTTTFSAIPLPVTSQEDLDNRTAGCATIFGDIQIDNSYTGSFVLHNVTNITGNLFADLYYDDNGEVAESGPPLLTSVECPELVTVGGDINFKGMLQLDLMSFPALEGAGETFVEVGYGGANLSFPALVNTGVLQITGRVTSMDFSSLRNVTGPLSVQVNDTDGWTSVDWGKTTPVDIYFPLLMNVNSISFNGNFSSIDLPALEIVYPRGNDGFADGINIANSGKVLSVTIPRLWNSTSVRLYGNIGPFSFPSLINVWGDFEVNTNQPLNVSIAPLETVGSLILTGNITGYDFSSLKNLAQEMYIESTLYPFDCLPAQYTWGNISHNRNSSNEDYDDIYQGNYIHCSGTAPYTPYNYWTSNSGLSTDAKKAIGFGVPVAVIIALFVGYAWWRDTKSGREALRKAPLTYEEGGVELETRRRVSEDVDGEVLPGYMPRGAGGHVVLEDGGENEEIQPPGYDAPHAVTEETTAEEEEEGDVRISADSRRERRDGIV